MKKIATAIKEYPVYSKHLNNISASPFTVSPSGLLFFIDSTLDNQPRIVIPEIYETQHNKTTLYQEDIINNIHTLVGHCHGLETACSIVSTVCTVKESLRRR